ncbi:unnamed protein product [Trichogramma brassicae]|uniref:Uncharacterized protein n=1 Tax=Trichogramma brassicae TaxID=86971 RepID=A0A6H5I667_9HYME|nr:unnamed protein product [Trichogramma brassicae]
MPSDEGVLGVPERWRLPEPVGKRQRLVLLSKRAGRLMLLHHTRPLCKCSTRRAKILERIVCRQSGGVHGGPRRPSSSFGSPAQISERKIDRRRNRVRSTTAAREAVRLGRREGAAASIAPSSPSFVRNRVQTRRGGTTSSPRRANSHARSTSRSHLQLLPSPECWNTTTMIAESRWYRSPKGRWTHRLIPNIRSWIEREDTARKTTQS